MTHTILHYLLSLIVTILFSATSVLSISLPQVKHWYKMKTEWCQHHLKIKPWVFACSDMYCHAKDRKMSNLKDFNRKQLLVHETPQSLSYGISTCSETFCLDSSAYRHQLRVYLQVFHLKVVPRRVFNLLMVLCDNIGFRRRWDKINSVGCSQFTVLQNVKVGSSSR